MQNIFYNKISIRSAAEAQLYGKYSSTAFWAKSQDCQGIETL